MNTWAPLWSGIVDSSIWQEDDSVRIIFVTMLAKKDSDHVVRASAFNIGKWANKTEKEVLSALKVLQSPDKRRIEKQPFDGRRVEKVEDGWLILNGETYRKMVSEEMRKARLRRAQTAYREKKKKVRGDTGEVSSGYRSAEERFVEAENNGNHELADKIAAEPSDRIAENI